MDYHYERRSGLHIFIWRQELGIVVALLLFFLILTLLAIATRITFLQSISILFLFAILPANIILTPIFSFASV